MKFIIESIKLTNWRGAESLFVELNPGHNLITGTNGTKKSTVAESYRWGVTGKDSLDRKDYDIKNSKRKELNSSPHELVMTLLVDGERKVIRRVYQEVITGAKGGAPKVTGHETLLWINDYPFKMGEFQAEISTWFSDQTFKLLTDPLFFNGTIKDKWDYRNTREILVQLAGAISDDDIYADADISKERRTILEASIKEWGSTDKLKKQTADKITAAKKDLAPIKPSIDSQEKTKPEVLDWGAIESEIYSEQKNYDNLTTKFFEESKGDELIDKQKSEKRAEIRSIEQDMLDIEAEIKRSFKEKNDLVRDEKAQVNNEIHSVNSEVFSIQLRVEKFEKQLKDLKEKKDLLLVKYKTLKSEALPDFPDDQTFCPTCKNTYPNDQLDTAQEKFAKNWNLKHANDVQEMANQGSAFKREIETLETAIVEQSRDALKLVEKKKELDTQYETLSAKKLFTADDLLPSLLENGKYDELGGKLQDAKAELERLNSGENDEKKEWLLADLKAKREASNQTLIELRNKLAKREQLEVVEKEIKELKEKQTRIGQTIADLEGIEFAITKFNRSKNSIVQDRVNKLFPADIHYDLFETQVNGETNDICEMSYKGVPWGTLNTGGKIYAGLECTKVLSEFYGLYLPVWIDNNESTLELPEMDTQTIGIYVIGQFLKESDPKAYEKIKGKLFVNGELIQ